MNDKGMGRPGRLKVFLGYAPGVGKTYRMLDEGRRRKLRGEDVVVAAVQRDLSPEVAELLAGFEIVPPLDGPGGRAIDVPALVRRMPEVCLIDGLAHDNPPGNANRHRWEDVAALLAAGINVITSINLHYVRERQPQVEGIRGKKVKESVPEAFLRTADEIEMVDAPPKYCLDRAGTEGAQLERQLSELREIALLLAADVVDHQLEDYLQKEGIHQVYATHERILVCVTPRSNAALMIGRGRSQAERFHGELYVLYIRQLSLSPSDEATLEANLECARQAGARVDVEESEDPIESIVQYAVRHGITQIFAGHTQQRGWWNWWKMNPVERLIQEASGIDVRIFPHSGARDE